MSSKKHPSSATLNIFLSILTIIFIGITSFKDGDWNIDYSQIWNLLYVILGAFVLALIVNWKLVNTRINKVKYRVSLFLNIVIEYRRGHLEFLDLYGKKAMYNEECLFNRIRRNERYETKIGVDGSIDCNIQTYNCYNSLNHSQNKLTITYGKKKENKDVFHNKRQLQFGYVVTLLDSYPEKNEYWETIFNHYTKVYELKVSFHKDNPPKNVEIFEVFYNEKGKEKLVELPIDPLIMQKYERIVMKIKLLHLKKGNRVRIHWNWDKPKKKK